MYIIRYSCQNLMRHEFSQQIFSKHHISNFMKICPMEAKVVHADGRTEMKQTAAFRSFLRKCLNITCVVT